MRGYNSYTAAITRPPVGSVVTILNKHALRFNDFSQDFRVNAFFVIGS